MIAMIAMMILVTEIQSRPAWQTVRLGCDTCTALGMAGLTYPMPGKAREFLGGPRRQFVNTAHAWVMPYVLKPSDLELWLSIWGPTPPG